MLLELSLITMTSLPSWGQLQKALDDPQTILEAVEELITAHNDDQQGHLGGSRSLETHKSESTIDHPAGSVIADKSGPADINFNINYQNLDGFTAGAGAEVGDLKCGLYVENGLYNNTSISFIPFSSIQWGDIEVSLLVESTMYFLNTSVSTGYIYWGRFGFEIEHGRVRGYEWLNDTETIYYTDWYTVDMKKIHTLRAVYLKNENIINYYVDNNLIDTISDEFNPLAEDWEFKVNHARGTASDDYLYVMNTSLSIFER